MVAIAAWDNAGGQESYAGERERIVRLCRQITGWADVAEDLAQETLAQAWRLRERVTDPTGHDRWLSAVARNICLRWMRAQGRERERRVDAPGEISEVPDEWDLEVELERAEIATLLDRALASLTPETRAALVAQYVEELPQSEIASRLGISPGAVAMRIQRGRLALRRILETDLRAEAEAYGLPNDATDWQETRIWCPFCGAARLHGSFVPGVHLKLVCPRCCAAHPPGFNVCCVDGRSITEDRLHRLFGDLKGYRCALNRTLVSVHQRYKTALPRGTLFCPRCDHENPLQQGHPWPRPPSLADEPAIYARCSYCGSAPNEALKHLALQTDEVRGFWRHNPRMRLLPYATVEHEGVKAWLTGFQSLTDGSRIEVVSRADTLAPITIRGQVQT